MPMCLVLFLMLVAAAPVAAQQERFGFQDLRLTMRTQEALQALGRTGLDPLVVRRNGDQITSIVTPVDRPPLIDAQLRCDPPRPCYVAAHFQDGWLRELWVTASYEADRAPTFGELFFAAVHRYWRPGHPQLAERAGDNRIHVLSQSAGMAILAFRFAGRDYDDSALFQVQVRSDGLPRPDADGRVLPPVNARVVGFSLRLTAGAPAAQVVSPPGPIVRF